MKAKLEGRGAEASSFSPVTTSEEVERVIEWMKVLGPQLRSLFPQSIKEAPPLFQDVKRWVDTLIREALEVMEVPAHELPPLGSVDRKKVFDKIQDAIIACLGSGRFLPPMRAAIIHSLRDGDKEVTGCPDKDCRNEFECQGNVFTVTKEERARFFIPHHKTERHNSVLVSGPIDVLLPKGPLADLLIFWKKTGWREAFNTVDPKDDSDAVSLPLFMKQCSGTVYTASEFSNYWLKLQARGGSTMAITLTKCRTSFVEMYIRQEPNALAWEGAAYLMGNTVARWGQTYAPSLKRMRMQEAADGHAAVLARGGNHRGGGGGGVGSGRRRVREREGRDEGGPSTTSLEGGGGNPEGGAGPSSSSAGAGGGGSSSSKRWRSVIDDEEVEGGWEEAAEEDEGRSDGLGSRGEGAAGDGSLHAFAADGSRGVEVGEVGVSCVNRFGYGSSIDYSGLCW